MANKCLLSVVVPTYNYACLLQRCLVSVLSQLPERCELIVVDDGSTDNTGAVLQEIEHKYPNKLRTIKQSNAGAGAARNNGLRHSGGDFVLFVDADDELTPGTLATVCEILRVRPELDLILGGHLACYPDGKEKRHGPGSLSDLPRNKAADYLLHKRVRIGHGSMVARKALIESRPYAEQFRKGEDIPVFAHLITNGQVACINHVMVRVYKHPTSLRHVSAAEFEDYRAFVDEVFDALPPECNVLKNRYSSQRCLSLFRSAIGSQQYDLARRYYRQAIVLDSRQALKWTYLSKAIRTWFR